MSENKYRHSAARTDILEFPGRSHFHMVQDGWKEIAVAIGDWLTQVDTKAGDGHVGGAG